MTRELCTYPPKQFHNGRFEPLGVNHQGGVMGKRLAKGLIGARVPLGRIAEYAPAAVGLAPAWP